MIADGGHAAVVPLAPTEPALRRALVRLLALDRVLTKPIHRIAYASDASFYRLIPQAVVQPTSIEEVRGLLRLADNRRIPLCFRAGGTSLSGQAVTDGILVDLSKHWRRVDPLANGSQVRVQPGVIGAEVNTVLRPFGAKMGPDPASIGAAMMGGILANNASGMCCGVRHNSYHTLSSLTFVLADGLVIDTAKPEADALFHAGAPALAAGVLALKQRIQADADLVTRIRAKYLRKNTTGYALNAFLDHERAVDIFAHLLVGSEGTLGFIAEAVLNTLPDLPHKRTAMLYFPDPRAAAAAVPALAERGAAAVEIMDRAALRSVQGKSGVPVEIAGLGPEAAALLVEFHGDTAATVEALVASCADLLLDLRLELPARFTADAGEQAGLWKIRKGMFPSVGAVRARGTSVILEDIAVPVERLADCVADLQALFVRHGYADAIIFGHAKDGNLHFVVSQGFADTHEIDRYRRFIDEMVALVVGRYDGSLKAEHGTGRNMAPFVETEWGREALTVMRELKQLADPHGILNPGVIINPHADAHVRDLKPMPVVEDEVDRCIECGFCEPKCPSRDLTLTPRQRIVVRRERARLQAAGESVAALEQAFVYEGLDTCATDGMCATACPVDIDTGTLVKRLRQEAISPTGRGLAVWMAGRFAMLERFARLGLRLGKATQAVIGARALDSLARTARRLTGAPIPGWPAQLPGAAPSLPTTPSTGEPWGVYVPACLTRTLASHGDTPLAETILAVAARGGRPLRIPEDITGSCCGMAFASKGYKEAGTVTADAFAERLWRWSREGRLPVVIDTAACTQTVRQSELASPAWRERLASVKVLDLIEFVHDLLPSLALRKAPGSVALHPTCSSVKLGIDGRLVAIARACSEQATVPKAWGCCGFAGDRGLLEPELTAAATAREAAELGSSTHTGRYSCSRTCELGLELATEKPWESFIHLVDRASRASAAAAAPAPVQPEPPH